MPAEEAVADVVSVLASVVERLDELALDLLREAAAGGATDRPALERRIVRARNAIERAIGLLDAAAGP